MTTEDQIAEAPPLPRRAEQGQPNIAASRLTDLQQQARIRIRHRPIVAVLAAVGAGYLVARLVSRAMR